MEPVFWMGGVAAQEIVEIRNDLAALREPGFWAILGTFEGEWTLARCEGILTDYRWPHSEGSLPVGEWSSTFDKDQYLDYVKRIQNLISAGDVYQVNACRILSATINVENGLRNLMSKILVGNPAPFASYLELPSLEIASASPERFVSIADGFLTTSPIKGTSRTKHFPEKDRAENLMIVDLMRNDVSKISETGTVSTPRLLATEEHPGLFHLVSDIKGKIKGGLAIDEVLRSLMPPGSVSGAPKSSAVRIIQENEPPRGPYCGAIGWYESGRAEIAVGIRTFWRERGNLYFGTGAGITWGSDPNAEWEETELKSQRLLSLLSDSA